MAKRFCSMEEGRKYWVGLGWVLANLVAKRVESKEKTGLECSYFLGWLDSSAAHGPRLFNSIVVAGEAGLWRIPNPAYACFIAPANIISQAYSNHRIIDYVSLIIEYVRLM